MANQNTNDACRNRRYENPNEARNRVVKTAALLLFALFAVACQGGTGGRPDDTEAASAPTSDQGSGPEDVLTPEDLVAGPAEYVIHEVSDFSFGIIRSRRAAEVTTPETDPLRVVEALMRAAIEVQLGNDLPDAVKVRMWEVWPPPPEPSQEDFDGWNTEQMEAYFRQSSARRVITYAPDRCGWSGQECDGTLWDGVTTEEMPAWMLRDLSSRVGGALRMVDATVVTHCWRQRGRGCQGGVGPS